MKYKKFDLLIIVIITIICLGYTYIAFENDIFYSIASGRDILKYGVDMIDHYSIHSLAYSYPHWLFDLIAYFIYCFGGFKGLYFSAIIVYIAIGVLLYFLTINLYKNRFISAVFTILAVISLKDFITVRAQSITYILFILEFFCIEKYLFTKQKKYLYFLIPISILILNMHCAVWPFFFILFMPIIVEQIILLYKNKDIKIGKFEKKSGQFLISKANIKINDEKLYIDEKYNLKFIFLIFFICLLTGLITLNGFTPYTYLIKTMMGCSTNFINEHFPATLTFDTFLPVYLIVFSVLFFFVIKKIRLRDFFLVIGLFILAFSSYRHLSLLIILGTFIIVKVLSDEKSIKFCESLIKYFSKNVIAVVMLFLFVCLSFSNYMKIYNEEFVNSKEYPVKAIGYIKENLDYKNIRMYNSYNYGSYILFNDVPVFIDSRADLYTKEFNKLDREIFLDEMSIGENWDIICKYYNLDYALIKKNYPLNYVIQEKEYNIEYEDEYFILYKLK